VHGITFSSGIFSRVEVSGNQETRDF